MRRAFARVVRGGGVPQFNPRSLFSGSETGFLYDLNDPTGTYQNGGGTTAGAVGQVVSVVRDFSRPETVKLTTLPAMTVSATVSQNGNVLTFTNSPANDQASGNPGLSTHTFYRMTFIIEGTGQVLIYVGGSPIAFSPGTYTLQQWFSGAGTSFIFRASTGGFNGTVTFVELREQLGNHLYQSTSAAKPMLRQENGNNYLEFDGADDSLSTVKQVAWGSDVIDIVAGVQKTSDAAIAIVAELSADSETTAGTFGLAAPHSAAGADYRFSSRGTVLATASAAGFTAPIKNVLTGRGNIAGDSAILRVNGTQVANVTTDQGTGTYTNQILYIGRRGGSTLPFTGRLYSMLGIARALTATELQQAEAWVAAKSGVTI